MNTGINIRFSRTEVIHLLVAWFAISLAFSFLFTRDFVELPLYIAISVITVGIGFLLHELAHKVVAQRYGAWAEFRMSIQNLMLAILLAYGAGIVFAAPGAVHIFSQQISVKRNGLISAAGPLTNLLLLLLFAVLLLGGMFYEIKLLQTVGHFGVLINSMLAAFNMIPFGVLDGRKIFIWNKQVYAALAAPAFLLFIYSIMFLR